MLAHQSLTRYYERAMTRSLILSGIIALSFMGIADSWYLYQSAVTDTALACDLGAGLSGCNVVAQSPYSYIFGMPLALYGVFFFAVVFAVAALLLVVSHRDIYRALYILGTFGAVASIGFLALQVFVIRALCIYCLASAAITFVLFVLARMAWRRYAPVAVIPVL